MDTAIKLFAGAGGVSSLFLIFWLFNQARLYLANRREAKAAEISTAAAHQEEQEARINALEELLKLKALPAPDHSGEAA